MLNDLLVSLDLVAKTCEEVTCKDKRTPNGKELALSLRVLFTTLAPSIFLVAASYSG